MKEGWPPIEEKGGKRPKEKTKREKIDIDKIDIEKEENPKTESKESWDKVEVPREKQEEKKFNKGDLNQCFSGAARVKEIIVPKSAQKTEQQKEGPKKEEPKKEEKPSASQEFLNAIKNRKSSKDIRFWQDQFYKTSEEIGFKDLSRAVGEFIDKCKKEGPNTSSESELARVSTIKEIMDRAKGKRRLEDKIFHDLSDKYQELEILENEIKQKLAAEPRAEEKPKEEQKKESIEIKEQEPEKTEPKEEKKEPTGKELTPEEQLRIAEEKFAIYRPVGWFRRKPVVRDLGYYAAEAELKQAQERVREAKNHGGKEELQKERASVNRKLNILSKKIPESPVLGRAELEQRQKKLEKRKKKLIKKLKKTKKPS